MQLRIGNGYDIHRLVPGRRLILGGVQLDHPEGLGLDGHSDADVLVHALMDALLGALSLGDIGKYFPPDDPRWRGADSLVLLEQVVALVAERGWTVVNVDAVVVAERPKLKPHIEAMRAAMAARIASMWGLSFGRSATTTESTLTTLQPRSRTKATTCSSSTRLSAPFHCGSSGGKYLPISPRLKAPSRASMIACASTSASLWPSRPRPSGWSSC